MDTRVDRCQCHVAEMLKSRDVDGLLGQFEAGASDHQWQVREFVAGHLGVSGMRLRGAGGPRWSAVEEALLADPVKLVRMAAAACLRSAVMRDRIRSWNPADGLESLGAGPAWVAELDEWMARKTGSLHEMDRKGTAPADIADLPCSDRRWAAHNYDSAAPMLVNDPVCEVRADAVARFLTGAPEERLAARARVDPCPRVRAAVIRSLGDTDVGELDELSLEELLAVASRSADPARLAGLSCHADDRVRAVVAANHATSGEVLRRLYEDTAWKVWTTAKQNPSWPADVWLRDPLIDHGMEQGRDPDRLALAVLRSRASVRCAEGRSRIYVGAGYMNPSKEAPWLCERDAVVLHSWGPFCWEHQMAVDECRQSGGSDGYLGQRLRSGLWVRVWQGGPIGPLAELWAGPW